MNLVEINTLSIFVRLSLAVVCGGILGIERGSKKRPAGFRTHVLVCIGASLAMMTSQYIYQNFGVSDPSRIGSQVVSGIGFLGAGTIIITGMQQVKGLTTAAGLWAAACMGIAIGIGFYEGAIIGCIFIFVVMTILHKLDEYVATTAKVVDLYMELEDIIHVKSFLNVVRENGIHVSSIEISRPKSVEAGVGVLLTLEHIVKKQRSELLSFLGSIEGVRFIEEL